jgi:hypothetical protein
MCDDNDMPTEAQAKLCAKPAEPTEADVIDNLPLILKKMGIPSCKNGKGVIFNPLGGVVTNTSSLSCESLQAITKSYLTAKTAVTCLVNKTSACSATTVKITNSIFVHNLKDGQLICNECTPGASGTNCNSQGLELGNFVDAKVISNNTQQSAVVSQVAGEATMDFVENLFKTALTPDPANPNGYPNTANQKLIEDVREELNVYLQSIQWNEVVQKAVNSIFIQNQISLINEGLIKGGSCKLNNRVIASLVADTLILSTIDGALDLQKTKEYMTNMAEHDKAAFPVVPETPTNWTWLYVTVGVLVGGGLIALLIFFLRRKKNIPAKTKSS